MHKVEFRIGVGEQAIDDIIARTAAAMEAVEAGRAQEPVTIIRFESWQTFWKVLTPNRIALIEHVTAHERVSSIRALAIALRRDYSAVHSDVTALVEAGLLGRDGNTITCDVEINCASMARA